MSYTTRADRFSINYTDSLFVGFFKILDYIRLMDLYHNILQTQSFSCRYEPSVKFSSWRSCWVRVSATESSRAMQQTERYSPSRQLVLSKLSKISVTVNGNAIRELKDELTGRFSPH